MELVWDKADCILALDGLLVVAAPLTCPPFDYQAIVEEQDTHLLLGRQTILDDQGKPAWYLANTLETSIPYSLGSVICKGHAPQRLLAVVHDIEQEPTCRTKTVKLAYKAVMQTVKERRLESLALPLLGTVHGKLSIRDSIQLLHNIMRHGSPVSLRRLWLILPMGSDCRCLAQLSAR